MKGALDLLVREAHAELGTRASRGVDWKAVDEALFDRLEQLEEDERAARTAARRAPTLGRAWMLAAAGLTIAVAGAMVVGKASEGRLDSRAPVIASGAVTLVSGDAVIGGRAAATGAELHAGDVVEAKGPVRMEARGKVWLLVERGSRARIEEARGELVVALLGGAIEADVNPVAEGEAFAVDVAQDDASVRVAVHGTHLRVARNEERVTVDLSEGVVTVGAPPRSGSTLGSLVTAPAHAELSVLDAARTLSVSHEAGKVRPPVPLRPSTQTRPVVPSPPTTAAHTEAIAGHALAPSAPGAHSDPRPSGSIVDTPPPSANPSLALPAIDPNAETTLASAVRSCMLAHPNADNFTVVVSTTLRLELNDDGSVRAALFVPPVASDVNACATATIYRTRFAHSGSASVPIDVTVPSSAP